MEEGQVSGEWKCVRILGRGSFGIVGLWKHAIRPDVMALKQFDSRMGQNESPDEVRVVREMQDRWRKEVELMYDVVKSPYVVSTLPVPEDFLALQTDLPLLGMQFCTGGDLRQLLRRPENISGLPEDIVRAVLSHIQQAISYLHERKILHRDLKPENILIEQLNGRTTYKLSDLGFAKNLSQTGTLCSTVVGTLQYLAPEIYVGKKYDETVDYWSFGFIAFEISCGMRPFLHGESPSRWYAYVETKPPNVIAIYRAESGGGVEEATVIPYNTHLSDLFKKCFETWLRMMLQFDPKRRGRKVLMSNSSGVPSPEFTQVVGLTVLHNILTTPMLTIYCPARKLAFAIGRSTTVGNIQTWIERDLRVPLGEQFILTQDGTKLLPDEQVLKYHQGVDLFMIPKTPSLFQMKLKIPKCVNKFLTAWERVKDTRVLRKVWISAVFFVQTEVDQIEKLKKASDALLKWRTKNLRTVVVPLRAEVEKTMASLCRILQFEAELEKIDAGFQEENAAKPESTKGRWDSEKEALEKDLRSTLENWEDHDLLLKPLLLSELQAIYERILRTYEDWRESSGADHIESLVRSLCLFVAQRDPVVDALSQNITAQLERLDADERVKERLEITDASINGLIRKVMVNRSEKQSKLLQTVFGRPSNSRGNVDASLTAENSTKFDLGSKNQKKVAETAEALGVDGIRSENASVALDLSSLMHQSQILDSETEDTLSIALKQAEDMLLAKEKMDWEFLG